MRLTILFFQLLQALLSLSLSQSLSQSHIQSRRKWLSQTAALSTLPLLSPNPHHPVPAFAAEIDEPMATATTKILDSIEYTVPFPSTEPNLLIRSLYSLPSSPPPSSPLKRTIPDPRLPHDSLLISVTVFQNSTQQTGSPTHGVKKGKFDLGGGGSSDFTYYSKPLLPPPFSAKEDDSGDRENGAETYVLTFGSGNSLPGFDLGLVGAREGDVREILIPPKVSESGEKKCIKKKLKKTSPNSTLNSSHSQATT